MRIKKVATGSGPSVGVAQITDFFGRSTWRLYLVSTQRHQCQYLSKRMRLIERTLRFKPSYAARTNASRSLLVCVASSVLSQDTKWDCMRRTLLNCDNSMKSFTSVGRTRGSLASLLNSWGLKVQKPQTRHSHSLQYCCLVGLDTKMGVCGIRDEKLGFVNIFSETSCTLSTPRRKDYCYPEQSQRVRVDARKFTRGGVAWLSYNIMMTATIALVATSLFTLFLLQ